MREPYRILNYQPSFPAPLMHYFGIVHLEFLGATAYLQRNLEDLPGEAKLFEMAWYLSRRHSALLRLTEIRQKSDDPLDPINKMPSTDEMAFIREVRSNFNNLFQETISNLQTERYGALLLEFLASEDD